MLSRFLDNDLRGVEAARFASHLNGCVSCRSQFEAMRAQRALLHALPTPSGSSAARARVLGRFEADALRPVVAGKTYRSLWRVALAPLAVSALAGLAVFCVTVGHGHQRTQSAPAATTVSVGRQPAVTLPADDTLTSLFGLHDAQSKLLSAQDSALWHAPDPSPRRRTAGSARRRPAANSSVLGGAAASATASRDPLNPDDIPEAL